MTRGTYYEGRRFQRGHGLFGSIMRSLAGPALRTLTRRAAAPVLKKLGKQAIRGALKHGKRAAISVVKDVGKGRSFKSSTKRAGQRLLRDLTSGAEPINARRSGAVRLKPRAKQQQQQQRRRRRHAKT